MALSGFIDISQRAWPTIALAGKCHISLFGDQGIDIEGRGGFRASDKKLIMYAEGKLKWLGREWLNGRIELGTNRIYLAGRTSFTLPLLAVPDGLKEQLGTLFLSLEIGGEFEMDSQGRLRKCVLDGQWLLAVKTPNAGEQVMPIAMQALNIDYRPLRVTSRATILPLVFIDSLALFPADGITLPIPNITTEKALYLTFEPLTLSGKINAPRIVAGTSSSANYKVPYEWEASTKSINMVNYVRRAYNKLSPVDFPRPSPMPKVNMSVPKFKVKKSIGIDKWYEYSFNVTSFDLPQLSVTKPNHTAKPLIEIPTELALDWQDTSLGTILENLNFSLAFGWQDKSPGIIVQYGRERSFIKF